MSIAFIHDRFDDLISGYSAAGFAERLGPFSKADLAALVASLERRISRIDEQLGDEARRTQLAADYEAWRSRAERARKYLIAKLRIARQRHHTVERLGPAAVLGSARAAVLRDPNAAPLVREIDAYLRRLSAVG